MDAYPVGTSNGELHRATFRFARLHRTYRQTCEFIRCSARGDYDDGLAKALTRKLKALRGICPALLSHPIGTPDSLAAFEAALAFEQKRAKTKALECYAFRMEGSGGLTKENLAAQRRWVKTRVQESYTSQAPLKRQVHEARHPFDQAVFTAGLWADIWNAPHPADEGLQGDLTDELDAKEDFIREFLT